MMCWSKPSKCNLAKSKVTYLNYVVSREGVTVDPDIVAAISKSFLLPQVLRNYGLSWD